MTVAEKITRHLKNIPEPLQAEVLNFVEYLGSKKVVSRHTQGKTDWSAFSLSQAMRGMENEQTSYSLKDLKEIFDDSGRTNCPF
ncbi:MAG: DUF2281 domain-containing protein [Candidatus Desantisbacteria bacterium]